MNIVRRIIRKLRRSKNLKHGHMNHTRIEGDRVIKNFVGSNAQLRLGNEVVALSELKDYLPLPELLSTDQDTLEVQMQKVSGINAADVKCPKQMEHIQYQCGQVLKKIHSIPVDTLEGKIQGTGSVILHGDFTIRNVLVSEQDYKIVAVLDWEKIRYGEPMKDLYWYEWVLRRSCTISLKQFERFYEGYGITLPEWEERKAGILKRVQRAIDQAVEKNDQDGIQFWQDQYNQTEQFLEFPKL